MDAVRCRARGGALKSDRPLDNVSGVFRDELHAARYLLDMGVLEGETRPHLIASGGNSFALARDMSILSGVGADLAAVVGLSPAWPGGPVFGAAAFDGTVIVDEAMKEICSVSRAHFYQLVEEAYRRVAEIAEQHQPHVSFPDLTGSSAIVIDDGYSGPLSVKAAIAAVRNAGARRVVLVMPVAERRVVQQCAEVADQTHCASLRGVARRPLRPAYALLGPRETESAVGELTETGSHI